MKLLNSHQYKDWQGEILPNFQLCHKNTYKLWVFSTVYVHTHTHIYIYTCMYITKPSTIGRTQDQFLSGVQHVQIQRFFSPSWVIIPRLKNPISSTIYPQQVERKIWIHAFSKGIGLKRNTNSLIQDLNLDFSFYSHEHFLYMYAHTHTYIYIYIYIYIQLDV